MAITRRRSSPRRSVDVPVVTSEIELSPLLTPAQQRDVARGKLSTTQQVELGIKVVEGGAMIAIFNFFRTTDGRKILEDGAKYWLFGAVGLLNVFSLAVVAYDLIKNWREISKKKPFLVRAIVEIGVALFVIGAIAIDFTIKAFLNVTVPMLFTGILAAKTLFHLGMSIYYAIKWASSSDETERKAYRQLCIDNLVGFVSAALLTLGAGLALVFGYHKMAALGMGGACVGTAYGAGRLIRSLYVDYQDRQANAAQQNQQNQARVEREGLLAPGASHDHDPGLATQPIPGTNGNVVAPTTNGVPTAGMIAAFHEAAAAEGATGTVPQPIPGLKTPPISSLPGSPTRSPDTSSRAPVIGRAAGVSQSTYSFNSAGTAAIAAPSLQPSGDDEVQVHGAQRRSQSSHISQRSSPMRRSRTSHTSASS